jgi:hypothetical protein
MKSAKAKPAAAPTKAAAPIKPTVDAKTAALRAKRLEREARAKAPSKPTTPPIKPEPKRGTGYFIRRAVISASPAEISNDEIDKQLTAAGFPNTKRSTIITCKQDCVNTLKVAQELGKLKLSNGVAENRRRAATVTVDAPAVSESAAVPAS